MPSTGEAKKAQNAKNNRKHNSIRDAKRAILRAARIIEQRQRFYEQQRQSEMEDVDSDSASSASSTAGDSPQEACSCPKPSPSTCHPPFDLASARLLGSEDPIAGLVLAGIGHVVPALPCKLPCTLPCTKQDGIVALAEPVPCVLPTMQQATASASHTTVATAGPPPSFPTATD